MKTEREHSRIFAAVPPRVPRRPSTQGPSPRAGHLEKDAEAPSHGGAAPEVQDFGNAPKRKSEGKAWKTSAFVLSTSALAFKGDLVGKYVLKYPRLQAP